MGRNNDLFTNRVIDNQTGEEVYASSLSTLRMAGWQAFSDLVYTEASPLLLPEDVETRLTFDRDNINFVQEDFRPRIGNDFYDLWDFDTDVVAVPNKNMAGTIYSLRIEASGKASTGATGIGCDIAIRIPSDIAIERHMYPLLKGTQNQRLDWQLQVYITEEDVNRGFEIYLQPFGADIEIWRPNILIKSGD